MVGLGAVTPLGTGVGATFDALCAGRSGVRRIQRFDASTLPIGFAAEGPDPARVGPDAVALAADWLERALGEALAEVDLSGIDPARIGVFVGAEAARPSLAEAAAALLDRAPASATRAAAHAPWAWARRVADRVGARGPMTTISTACTSSAQAVGEGALAVRRGEVDVAVVVGVDVLVHPLMVTGFARLGALSARDGDPAAASRPFDAERDGFVLGEGAGVLVLAAPAVAAVLGPRRGAVVGVGGSSNAWRITDSPPDGRGAAAAVAAALADAGVGPDRIVAVFAHGTATRQNDESEARGLRTALGADADRVVVTSTKGALGHLVAACGVVDVALALTALRRGIVPPVRNLDRPDPACPLRFARSEPTPIPVGLALCNAFGFGGANASLVVGA